MINMNDLEAMLEELIVNGNNRILELVKSEEYTKRELAILGAKVETCSEILDVIKNH